jgi:murein DD-endopeptidase MepM/ murein hydrolase activator NlpD
MTLLSQRKRSGSGKRFFVVVLLAAVVGGGVFLWREWRLPAPATVEITADHPGIGRDTRVRVRAREPVLGLQRLAVVANGAGYANKVLAEVTPRADARERTEASAELRLGKQPTPDIKPGTLTLEVVVQARGTRLRTPAPVVVKKPLEVKLTPPAVAATSQFVHPTQGGAEVVVYEVGPGPVVNDGVRVGAWFFPGFPLPGGTPAQRFALFAVPYDLDVDEAEARTRFVLSAEDPLGNRAEATFIHKYFRRPLRKDVIELKETFMKKVTDEIYGRTPALTRTGNLLDDYLQLNRDLRKQNNAELVALAKQSQPRFLWRQTFVPMQNAAVKGSFADRRAYVAKGKQVDAQDHLGFDLASLRGAPVLAGNAGAVVLARYFGIFGNCVVLDHGYGLQSLYAHLSTIAVKEGASVDRGQELGRTGATGLAGGDHLHFTTLIGGLAVNPIEWWDDHWIKDRLKLKLGNALPWTAP